MERNKKWFSFVEIIIVISILILLWFVVMKISGDSKQKTMNATIESQLSNLWVALNSEITEKKELSLPNGTLNYFNKEWWYSHENFSDKDSESIWVYGVLSQSNFLSEIPRDPRNNQYYSYGLLKDKQTFEVAWVIKNWADYLAKISGNYTGDKWTISLIREYNWPYFIADWEGKLPYNPEKVLLTATDKNWNSFEEKDILEYKDWKIFKNNVEIWKIVDLATEENWKKYYDLYFSEWSIARLDLKDEIKLTFWRDNDLFTFVKWNDKSKIAMFLDAGSMWIFAWSQRESDSDFSVTTADTTAAVRWTIFWVNADKKQFTLVKWKIEVIKRESDPRTLNPGEIFIIDRNEKTRVNIPADKIPYPLNKVTENKGWELAPNVVVYELLDDCYNSDCIKRTVKSESLVDSEERTSWEMSLDKFYEWKKFYKSKIDAKQWELLVTKSLYRLDLKENKNKETIISISDEKVTPEGKEYYSANCFRIYKDDNLTKFWNICKDGKYQPEAVKKNYSKFLGELEKKVFDRNIRNFSDITKSDNYFWITTLHGSGVVDKVFFFKGWDLYVYYPKTNSIDIAYVPVEWLKFVTWNCFTEQYGYLTQSINDKKCQSNKILDWKTWILSQKPWESKTDNNYKTPDNEPSSISISGTCYKPWNLKEESECNISTADLSNILDITKDNNHFYWVWNNVDDKITEIYTKEKGGYILNTIIGNNEIKKSRINNNFTWVFYRGDCFEWNINSLRIKQACREKTSDLVADTCIKFKEYSRKKEPDTCPNKDINAKQISDHFPKNVTNPSINYDDFQEIFKELDVYLYEKNWKLYFKKQNWEIWLIFLQKKNKNGNKNENENENENENFNVVLHIGGNVKLDTGKAYHPSCFSTNGIDKFQLETKCK